MGYSSRDYTEFSRLQKLHRRYKNVRKADETLLHGVADSIHHPCLPRPIARTEGFALTENGIQPRNWEPVYSILTSYPSGLQFLRRKQGVLLGTCMTLAQDYESVFHNFGVLTGVPNRMS